MRKAFSFQEFNPRAYGSKIDWRSIALRYMLMASIVVVPVVLAALQYLKVAAPGVLYFMGGIASLYVPALLLVRRPRVTVTKDFQIALHNPKTVDTRILVKAACSAGVYFALLSFAIFILGGRI